MLWRVCFYKNKRTETLVIKEEEGGKPRDEQTVTGTGKGPAVKQLLGGTNPTNGAQPGQHLSYVSLGFYSTPQAEG